MNPSYLPPQEQDVIICTMYVCIYHVGNVSLQLYNKHVQKKGSLLTKLNEKFKFTITSNSEWTTQLCIIKSMNGRIPFIWHWQGNTGARLAIFWINRQYIYSPKFVHAILYYCPRRMCTSVTLHFTMKDFNYHMPSHKVSFRMHCC